MKSLKLGLSALLGLLITGLAAPAFAGDMADKAVGVWLRPSMGWNVEFSMCGDKLCGEVVSGDDVDKKTGESVVGIKMLYDLKKIDDDKWKGKMYNPGDGGTYKGIVRVMDENTIKMSGCMMGIMCRSEVWTRVEEAPMMDEPVMEEDSMMDGRMMGDDMSEGASDMGAEMSDGAGEMKDEMGAMHENSEKADHHEDDDHGKGKDHDDDHDSDDK